jgi:predicted MFS family arabinose efflux permease
MSNKLIINRIAVASYFFIGGFQGANWVARIPELQRLYGFDNSTLGTILLFMAGGAVLAMPFAGVFMHHFQSKQVTSVATILQSMMIPLIPHLSHFWIIAFVFVGIGAMGGAFDVAVNGQAVLVEKRWGKTIMSSFHAVFSIGMALGAGSGALFAKLGVDLGTHLLIIAVFSITLAVWAMFQLLPDDPVEGASTEGGGFQLPTKEILPLGIIAFCGMTGEGTMMDWSALYMNKVVGENESTSALAFGSFATAMTIGRLIGDYNTMKFGKRKLLIINSLVAIFGLAFALMFPFKWTVMLGFFFVGLGLATVVPIIYSTAGSTEGVKPSVGIAMATTIGYAGFFVGPPVIGYLADIFSLRGGLGFTMILFFTMLYLVYKQHFNKTDFKN